MKRKKILLAVLLLVAIAAVVSGVAAFRTKPVMTPEKDYLMHVENGPVGLAEPGFYLWPQGPDDSYETRERVAITAEQEQTVLEILSRYEKRLSWEKMGWVPVQKFFPQFYVNVEAEMPPWVGAQVVLYEEAWAETEWEDTDIFNIVLGEGHAQQRSEYTFHPPYYTIENEEQLYAELAEVLGLEDLLAGR